MNPDEELKKELRQVVKKHLPGTVCKIKTWYLGSGGTITPKSGTISIEWTEEGYTESLYL